MTIADDLDRLAAAATDDLDVHHPAVPSPRRSGGRRPRRVAALAIAVTVAAIIAAVVVVVVDAHRHAQVTAAVAPLRLAAAPGTSQVLIDHPGSYTLIGPPGSLPHSHLSPVLAIDPDLACYADWHLGDEPVSPNATGDQASFVLDVRSLRRPVIASYRFEVRRLVANNVVPLGGLPALRASAACRPPLPAPAPVRGTPTVSAAEAVAAAEQALGGTAVDSVTIKLVSRSQLYLAMPAWAPHEADRVDSDPVDISPVWVVALTSPFPGKSGPLWMISTVDAWAPPAAATVGTGTSGNGPLPAWFDRLPDDQARSPES